MKLTVCTPDVLDSTCQETGNKAFVVFDEFYECLRFASFSFDIDDRLPGVFTVGD
jgi:hypothetical protein